jgi:esterase/lipase
VADELFQLMDSNRGRARHVRAPLLMVLSQDDQIVDWRAAQEFYEQASSLRKKLVLVKDARHAIPVDYGWENVTREIADFVRQP